MNEWAESRLKSILKEPLLYGLNESAEEDRTDWPRYIRITDFDDFNNLSDDTFRSLSPLKAKDAWLKNGDILFARSGATAGKTYLYSSLPNGACYAGYLIRARLSQKKVFPNFLSYFTKSFVYENWKNRVNIQTTIQNISAEKYYQMPFRYPDLDTQRRIVTYLDSHVTSIDKRVSLLTTKRDHYLRLKTAIINRAVTQGLNPEVKMKDTGVEWIGMIPEHWEVKRGKDLGDIEHGISYTPDDLRDEGEGILVLRAGNIQNSVLSFEDNAFVCKHRIPLGKYIKKGDIIICGTNGSLALVGKSAVASSDYNISFGSFMLRFRVRQNPFFIQSQLAQLVDLYRGLFATTTINQLTISQLNNMRFFIPPLSEQQAIASYLDEKCTKIDAIVENLNQQIEKHKLLKRALINEVITGQRVV